MKIGDKAKGFRFTDLTLLGLGYYNEMDPYVGVEGEIVLFDSDKFIIKFEDHRSIGTVFWTYPIADYLQIQREERFKELGL